MKTKFASLALGTGIALAIMLAAPLRAQFVYVASASNTVSGYSIDRKTGALTPVPGSPFPTGQNPGSVAVDSAFVYVTNSSSLASNTVSGYSIDRKTGALTPVPGSPFPTGAFPDSVDSTARFAYVANDDIDAVSGYSIDRKTGALTPVPGSPFATGLFPNSIAISRH